MLPYLLPDGDIMCPFATTTVLTDGSTVSGDGFERITTADPRYRECAEDIARRLEGTDGERSVAELLVQWSAIMRELRDRDVVRTNNNPVGDIAEAIVAAHYNAERGGFSQKGWDVRTESGERIQVKAIRTTADTKRRNLSPIRDTEYDSVVIVIFDEDFRVVEGLKLDRAVVENRFEKKAYVNGWVITVTESLRQDVRVQAVDLAATARTLHA